MAGESAYSKPFSHDAEDDSNSLIGYSKKVKSRIKMVPYAGRPCRLPEGVANEELTETEGERQLKRLLDQQLDTQLTLQQQYQRHRTFQPSSTYVSITREIRGKLTSTEFRACELQKRQMDELREMGLDNHELALKLQHNGYEKDQNSFGKEPSILKQQLEAIETKLHTKKAELLQPNTFRDAKQLSRHEMDLEKSLKPTSHQVQLLRNLVTIKRPLDEIHPAHPINHLKDLEEEILTRVHRAHVEAKKLLIEPIDENLENPSDRRTRMGMDTSPVISSTPLANVNRVAANKVEQTTEPLFTKKDPVIRDFVIPIPDEEIKNNKLSTEQIRHLPRFANYHRGEPNGTLYLKNLASDVTETDLVALFDRYQTSSTDPVEYRLMKGKMKGQAFVKFSNVEMATQALQFVNGFMWKGKPIIIQYGRQVQ